ncbi:MAG: hypothetical protein AB2536_09155 [Candidatus Thiodiazotropha endolucinida]
MDFLVIGIDGGTKEIIDNMPMPFTQSLFKGAGYKILEEDLISRGWAEALTGCHASENKGFYLMPFSDQTYDFNHAYSKEIMVSESPNEPLWSMLNNKGVRVGIVNVPTTGPAPDVNGFIISGGGGGLGSIGDIPANMYHPRGIEAILRKHNYIFDIRPPGGCKTVSEFIRKITDAEVTQKNTFIELTSKEKPGFGFYCFRMTTSIQYLARYEIDRCMDGINKAKENRIEFKTENTIQENLISHYKMLDESIKEMFDSLNPKHYLFIGDHSTALYKKDLNLDVWLESHNLLQVMNQYERFFNRLGNYLSKRLFKLTNYTSNKKSVRKPMTRFKPSKTQAFGTFYDIGNFAGVFINDSKRFGGPICSETEVEILVNDICSKFNADPLTQSHHLYAKPFQKLYENSRFSYLLPDIQITKPDTTYSSGRYWEFISDNPNLTPLEDEIEDKKYPYTGIKGSDPLFIYSKGLENYIQTDDPNDLTLVYKIIDRYFSLNTLHDKRTGL